MDAEAVTSTKLRRPWGIYFFALWALIRAGALVYPIWGQYLIDKVMAGSYTGFPEFEKIYSQNFFQYVWAQKVTIIPLLFALAFVVICFGLAIGKSWGRTGYLIISFALIFLNAAEALGLGHLILATASFPIGGYAYPLYSLVAFGISWWYFRRSKVMQFYKIEIPPPKPSLQKILDSDLVLAVSLALFMGLIANVFWMFFRIVITAAAVASGH